MRRGYEHSQKNLAHLKSGADPLKRIDATTLRIRLVDAKEQGKDKPSYVPNQEQGDIVVVTNAKHVTFTGKKWDQKIYRWHTGFPGGLKEIPVKREFEKDPGSILFRAVNGMLPKNKLRRARALKLRIYPEDDHPFKKDPRLVKFEMPYRKIRTKEPLFELPEGFEPMNRAVYRKRFGHLLPGEILKTIGEQFPSSRSIPAEKQ